MFSLHPAFFVLSSNLYTVQPSSHTHYERPDHRQEMWFVRGDRARAKFPIGHCAGSLRWPVKRDAEFKNQVEGRQDFIGPPVQ